MGCVNEEVDCLDPTDGDSRTAPCCNREANPFLRTVRALDQSESRFVIVGGFAVVMYGSNRFTPDLNLVIDLAEDNCLAVIRSLTNLGFRSVSDANPELFAQAAERERLAGVVSKDRRFLSLRNYDFPCFSVEIFFESPLPFAGLYADALTIPYGDCSAKICSVEHLLCMKKAAGRNQDLIDIDNLEAIRLIAPHQEDPDFEPRCLPGLPQSIDAERAVDLTNFMRMSPLKKMDWLHNMLEALGSFCSM